MIIDANVLQAACEPVRIVVNADPDERETVEVDRGIDGGVDICWQTPFSTRLIALCDAHAAETARAVLSLAEPGSVVLTATQAKRLAVLGDLLWEIQPTSSFGEEGDVLLEIRGIGSELRLMTGRKRMALVR